MKGITRLEDVPAVPLVFGAAVVKLSPVIVNVLSTRVAFDGWKFSCFAGLIASVPSAKVISILPDVVFTSAVDPVGLLAVKYANVAPTTATNNVATAMIINKTSEDSTYIPADKIKYGTGTAKKLTESDAPATLKGVAEFANYYDFAIGTGTNKGDETTDSLELVYGEFLDTQNASGADKKVTFRLVMIFPDTEDAQDYNTSATFNGILKVTTTADGSPRA